MKSKLFEYNKSLRENEIRLESLRQDVDAMLGVGVDKLPGFVEVINESLATRGAEPERLAQDAVRQLGVARPVFDRASNVARWLVIEFLPEGFAESDSVEAVIDDLLSFRVIVPEQKAACTEFVSALKALAQERMRAETESERALQRGAPKVVGVETAVFFRRMFKKKPGDEG